MSWIGGGACCCQAEIWAELSTTKRQRSKRRAVNASPSSSLFYAVYLFQQAFRQFDFGFASAMAWLLFLIVMAITLIQVKLSNRFVYYEGDR